MANYIATDTDLTAVANAIRTKGGTSENLEFPSEFVTAIQNIPTGGSPAIGIDDTQDSAGGTIRTITAVSLAGDTVTAEHLESGYTAHDATGAEITGTMPAPSGPVGRSDVNFYDYDGTLVASHTKAEINAMTSDSDLPANPTHTGLTAQGWNWTVAQLKAQLTAMPNQPVDVGQMYITASGDTEIDVVMQECRLSPILTLAVNGEVSVDWGDNTTPYTVTGTSLSAMVDAGPHTYASAGSYTIKIHVISGGFTFYNDSNNLLLRKNATRNENRVYANCVQNIRIGSGITVINQFAFAYCYSLETISIPSSVTSINGSAFYYCYSIASVTIPSGVTSVGSSVFSYCYSLASVTIPNSVTSIEQYAFSYCYSLASVTIPRSVTSISNYALYYCHSLASITIPTNVTSIDNSAFYNCYSLASITIPSDVTSIGAQAFYYCYSLANVTIPSGVTSIGNSAFTYGYSLASITIPSSVTSIGTQAFYNCYGIAEYHFQRTTPPTLSNANTFTGIVSDCIMYVPYSADHSVLNAYKTASNWSNYASYMQEEPAS